MTIVVLKMRMGLEFPIVWKFAQSMLMYAHHSSAIAVKIVNSLMTVVKTLMIIVLSVHVAHMLKSVVAKLENIMPIAMDLSITVIVSHVRVSQVNTFIQTLCLTLVFPDHVSQQRVLRVSTLPIVSVVPEQFLMPLETVLLVLLHVQWDNI
jgi:hypothetical protein